MDYGESSLVACMMQTFYLLDTAPGIIYDSWSDVAIGEMDSKYGKNKKVSIINLLSIIKKYCAAQLAPMVVYKMIEISLGQRNLHRRILSLRILKLDQRQCGME